MFIYLHIYLFILFICFRGGDGSYYLISFFIHLSFFILETLDHSEQVGGCKLIAHKSNANLFNSIKEIRAKNNKSFEVYCGPLEKLHIDESKLIQQYTAYFERNFETSAHENPLILPSKIPIKFEKITQTMGHWCRETNELSNIKGLVLHSFSLLKYLFLHGFTEEMLKDYLKIEKFSEIPIIVVYNPHKGAVLLLRQTQSKKLSTDIALAVNDLKLFILLFYDVLTKSEMKVIPLVITDEKVNPDNIDCPLCMNHILSEENFTNITKFNFWLEEKENYFETEYKCKINEAFGKLFSAKLVSVLATVPLYTNDIPNSTDSQNFHQLKEHLTVLLTPAQMDAYYSQDKHMIIKGGFGCGKSTLAAALVQKISESLEEDEKLFYICYDPRSELLNQMVKNNQRKSIDKVRLYYNKDRLQLSAIIEDITKPERTEKINFVVDEYDGEDLDDLEAKKLNYIFNESLKEAFIALIPQPIEKERVVRKIPQKRNRFDQLMKTMKTYHLTLNMRNSISIHNLVEATKEALSEQETIFRHPKGTRLSDDFINSGKSAEENSIANKFLVTQENTEHHKVRRLSEAKAQSEKNSVGTILALDEAQAIIGSSVVDDADRNVTVSKFVYAEALDTGHRINTQRAVIYDLGDQGDFHKNLSLVAIFNRVVKTASKHVVVHLNFESNVIPSALRFVFEHHFNILEKVTTKFQEFASSKKSILVSSFRAIRGMGFPNITILIDCDIYFLQHYLVEVISRCTTALSIIVLKNSSFMKKLTTEWKNKELVKQWETKICKKSIQTRDCNFHYDVKQNIIIAEFRSEYYKRLEKAFQLSVSKDETAASIKEFLAEKTIIQKR